MAACVLIGIPSGTDWKADMAMCLMQLVAYSCRSRELGELDIQFGIDNPKGSILSVSRQTIVTRAMEMGASHILFIDSDMEFPAQTMEMLLAHAKPVVACNCVTKKIPGTTTARTADPKTVSGRPLYTTQFTDELVQVQRVGTGIMLVDMSVFSAIEPPYFEIKWDPKLKSYQGEDWAFCEKLEAAGIPIYVDQFLSQAIGHIGAYSYRHDCVDVPAGLLNSKGLPLEG